MTAAELRKLAAEFRTMSRIQSEAHVECARALAVKVAPGEEIALLAFAGVHDCMARRYRQWADHLDEAANEICELK